MGIDAYIYAAHASTFIYLIIFKKILILSEYYKMKILSQMIAVNPNGVSSSLISINIKVIGRCCNYTSDLFHN